MAKSNETFIAALATPLASIFGSGFLVIIPILAAASGSLSIFAMLLITVFAYCVGEVIRFNIRYAEPALEQGDSKKTTHAFELCSDIALVLAYVISISLYLRILSAFLLEPLQADTEFNEQSITTGVILFIALYGVFKGLKSIEKLEFWSLAITMLIILVVILSFAAYDFRVISGPGIQWPNSTDSSPWYIATILAGTLIVVQGFETSRYLENEFSSDVRIRTSRASQIISTIVYLLFVALATPLMHFLQSPIKSNDLIMLAGKAFMFLPMLVIFAAVLSQFSAAVADTIAGVGNLFEVSKSKINMKVAYLLIGSCAIALTWSVSTFQLVALASRAFAFYYLLQCFVAISVARTITQKSAISLIASVLLFVTLFAVPVG